MHPPTIGVMHEAGREWLAKQSPRELERLPALLRRRGLRRLVVSASAPALPKALGWPPDEAIAASPHDIVHMLRCRRLDAGARRTLHGVLVRVYGLGVLITGAAGAGKSTLALELVDRGHRLVADDAVEVWSPASGVLYGQCPPMLEGLLAVRGPGVLDIGRAYGAVARGRQRVDLAVRLGAPAPIEPGRRPKRRLAGVSLPALSLGVPLGHNPSLLIEAACRDEWLRRSGHDAGAELVARQRKSMKQHP